MAPEGKVMISALLMDAAIVTMLLMAGLNTILQTKNGISDAQWSVLGGA
jgi:hypothetical protein